jgi:hypothetical protein
LDSGSAALQYSNREVEFVSLLAEQRNDGLEIVSHGYAFPVVPSSDTLEAKD